MDFEAIQRVIDERVSAQNRIYGEISSERWHQFKKWGDQHRSKLQWLAILMEEVGEVAKDILENNDEGYEKELIQVAATVVTTLEDIRRGN